ncbi:MAG TPA: hypothetical protein DCG75_15985 [Bacteroidales bacterium]|nr:hypothetical protein [Bacteroidales bacterium]
MIKYFLTVLLIPILVFSINAQENDTTLLTKDSSIVFLNITEHLNTIYSEIEIVTEKEFDHLYSVNFLSTLRGKMNGVEVQTGTWGNNASSFFFIRGEKNISSSNQPIIVIDGIPITNQISSTFGFDFGNLANDWNLDDIESVSVLKGGQAASLYGNQAGNGAIIIQTKKAKEKGLHIDFNTSFLASQIADFPEFQNSYGQGSYGQFEYFDGLGGGINDGIDYNWGPPLDIGLMITQFDGPAAGYINGEIVTVRGGDVWAREQAILNGFDSYITPTPWVSHPNNMKDYFKTAMTYANNLGISWVNKYGGIRVSYTNVQADNVSPNSSLTKNTITTNLDYTFFDRLNIFGSINNTILEQSNLIIPGDYNDLNPMAIFPWLGRQVDMNSLKDYWQAGQKDIQFFNYNYSFQPNPWSLAYENRHDMNRNNLFSSYGVKLDVLKGFSINYIGGYNNINSELRIDNNIPNYNNSGKETYDEKNIRHNVFYNFDLKIGKNHFINHFAGFYKNIKEHKKYYTNLPFESSIETVISSKNNDKTTGYYGGLSYSCYNILYSQFTLSKDVFNIIENVKTPIYPALSVGLEFSSLLKVPHIISQLNLHGGYSKVGLNNVPINTFYSNNNQFPTTSQNTLGYVIGFIKNRVSVQGNWYSNMTENSPVVVYVSGVTGYLSTYNNIGKVENKGFEFNLAMVPIITKNISWKSEFTYFKNRNKVVDLGNFAAIINSGSWNVNVQSRVGLPVSNLYGSQFLKDEDQIVFSNGLPRQDNNYAVLGDVNPDYIMYFSNNLNIYKFKISLLLNYSKGGVYYSPFFWMSTTAGSSYHTVDRNRGVVGQGVMWDETSNSYVPNNILVNAKDYYNYMADVDEYAIMDATSLSIDEISISYDFRFMEKFNLTCTLFGTNIYTWAKNHDYNQSNIQFNYNQFYRGINDFSLPSTRTYGLKLKLNI